MNNLKQPQRKEEQEKENDPYAVYSSDDEDIIQSDEDLEKMPGIYLDAPVIAKQLVKCFNKGCEGDALKRHSRDKCRWPDGAFCLKCRLHGKPKQKKEPPQANQDWQEVQFQATMKELRILIDIEEEVSMVEEKEEGAKRLHETSFNEKSRSTRIRSNSV